MEPSSFSTSKSSYFHIFPYISIHVHTFPMEKRCDFALMALRRSSKSRQLRVPKRRLPRRAKTTREAWPGLGPWDPGTLSRDFHGSKMVPFWRILEDHQKRWTSRWNVVKKIPTKPCWLEVPISWIPLDWSFFIFWRCFGVNLLILQKEKHWSAKLDWPSSCSTCVL